MSIIDLNKVKRVSRMSNRGLIEIAIFHFDDSHDNHKTVVLPSDYLVEELKEAIHKTIPGEDIEWKKFLRENQLEKLLDDKD